MVGGCAINRIYGSASPRNRDVDPTLGAGRPIFTAVVEAVDAGKAGIGRVGEAAGINNGNGDLNAGKVVTLTVALRASAVEQLHLIGLTERPERSSAMT
jgi:hypothetical protein